MVIRTIIMINAVINRTGMIFLYLVTQEKIKYAKVYNSALQIITSAQPNPSVNFDNPQSETAEATATNSGLTILKFNINIVPIAATIIVAILSAALANPTNLLKYAVNPQYKIPKTAPIITICQAEFNWLMGRESISLLIIFATLEPPYNPYYTFLLPN